MSKKNRKQTPEIPQVGNALEVPNYVAPATDLEYKQIQDTLSPRGTGCGDRRPEDCLPEDCRR